LHLVFTSQAEELRRYVLLDFRAERNVTSRQHLYVEVSSGKKPKVYLYDEVARNEPEPEYYMY
jgi:hypothetical protein